MDRYETYTQTVQRLARGGIKDPTAQIVALAEEIERYREKIYGLEDQLKKLTKAPGSKKLTRNAPLLHPYIELRPTCSECGAVLENVAAGYELIERPNITSWQTRITPGSCPDCGACFEYVVFQGELTEKEEQHGRLE